MSLTAALVARCERIVEDPGPDPGGVYLDDAGFREASEFLVSRRPPGPLWLFAYGSLIWRPEVEFVEQRRAHARGWHRAFSIELTRWRGEKDQPGLMLALEPGGSCVGVAYRLPDDDLVLTMERLLRREIDEPCLMSTIRWITVEAGGERLQALSFWTGAKGFDFIAKRPLPETARMIASACGHLGSGAAYLFNTVSHLEALGIHDRRLWTLQKLVAEDIICRTGPADGV